MADIRKYYGVPDIGVVLLRDRKNKGFLPDIVKGEVDEVVREKLELGKVKRRKVDAALAEQMRPLQYRHDAIEFDAGPRRYLLAATSGATIPGDVHAKLSKVATLLLHEYAQTVRKQARQRKDA